MKYLLTAMLSVGCLQHIPEPHSPTPKTAETLVIGAYCNSGVTVTAASITGDILTYTAQHHAASPVDLEVRWNGMFINTLPKKIQLGVNFEDCAPLRQTQLTHVVTDSVSLDGVTTNPIIVLVGPFSLLYTP